MAADLGCLTALIAVLLQETAEQSSAEQAGLKVCQPSLLMLCLLCTLCTKLIPTRGYDAQHPASHVCVSMYLITLLLPLIARAT